MKQRFHSKKLIVAVLAGTTLSIVGCGGAIPVGLDPVFADGEMTFDPGTGFNGQSTTIADPEVTISTSGQTTIATFTQDGRTVTASVPTDRPVLGQIFNVHSGGASATYSDPAGTWESSAAWMGFANSDFGPAVRLEGNIIPVSSSPAAGEAETSMTFGIPDFTILTQAANAKGMIYQAVPDGTQTQLMAGTNFGTVGSSSGGRLALSFTAGNQRLLVLWMPSGSPGQVVGTDAEVLFVQDVGGSGTSVGATSGHVHLYYDSNTQVYSASLVNVVITYGGNTYRFDGFVSGSVPA